jgi:ribonuclease HI
VAILKALQQIQKLQLTKDAEKIAVVNTDNKVTLDTLRNRNKHYVIIEDIRKEINKLEELRWTVFFNWAKAHVGTQGNELADRLAKKAATEYIGEIVNDKIPRETIITEGKEIGLTKWQEP